MEREIGFHSLKGILDRDKAIEQSQELIDKWSFYLEELVNYASNLLGRCEKSLKRIEGTPSTLIYLYYHVIQMADGIQVMCLNGCFAAAIPALRSLWEGVISMDYILQSNFEVRSTSWLACCHLDSKEYWELQDTSSAKGKKITEMKKKDKYFSTCELGEKDQNVVKKQIQAYDKILKKDKFAFALSKLSKGALRSKKWYSVNSGPRSISALADELDRSMEYAFLYSNYSAISHAKDVTRVLSTEHGIAYFEPIRSSSNGLEVYSLTCSYLIMATILISDKLRPADITMKQLRQIIKRHRPEALRV